MRKKEIKFSTLVTKVVEVGMWLAYVEPGVQVYIILCGDHANFSCANKRKKNW